MRREESVPNKLNVYLSYEYLNIVCTQSVCTSTHVRLEFWNAELHHLMIKDAFNEGLEAQSQELVAMDASNGRFVLFKLNKWLFVCLSLGLKYNV